MAQGKSKKQDVAASSLDSYLARVHAEDAGSQTSPGSIWTENGRMARMGSDMRGRFPHDLIKVVVQESVVASTDGAVKGSRTSNASSQIT
ncbi:MAG: flagellar basal body L-ring protein FlgH, partial [Acidobacteria bacterium]|nr:flagellar basal body L-ring protein FlgH [Acidobacteriota bacterium]